MEAVEELPVQSTMESVKVNTISDGEPVLVTETSLCHTSNGVADSTATPLIENTESTEMLNEVVSAPQVLVGPSADDGGEIATAPDISSAMPPEEEIMAAMETDAVVEKLLSDDKATEEITEEIIETSIDTSEAILCNEVTIEGSNFVVDSTEVSPDKVTLRTEILVEKSEEDIPDSHNVTIDHENANNILSNFDQGELSEALRSSDTTDHAENNNGTMRVEVFNKEELLDILEGNDDIPSSNDIEGQTEEVKSKRMLETQIALNQLSRLHRQRMSRNSSTQRSPSKMSKESGLNSSKDETPKKRRGRKKENKNSENLIPPKGNQQENTEEVTENVISSGEVEEKKNDSIVNTLVKDWDDDEPSGADQSNQSVENINNVADQIVKTEDCITSNNEDCTRTSLDTNAIEGQTTGQNKSGDESQPQRGRAGRVIKKKVIFDPDNPDTFTKGKVVTKTKEPQSEKEQPPPKKVKAEPQRASSKSPTSKLQWKKPAAKNTCKQNKRLTEVDKLLMDEGAVNMIYQLTPEAPKGKKNMKTKAEIIKKIQSSTPEGNKDVMKFRERKKEAKGDGEAKKIIGGKSSRSSLSGSVKSPTACEDFETHSADDSIIYRRHSSSSYSSACMSPRRLSDVESGTARVAPSAAAIPNNTLDQSTDNDKSTDIFMADADNSASEIINKDDCLSIKEKLNTKLSLALNKRKRESTIKTDKLPKQKRVSKNASLEKESNVKVEHMKHVSVNYDQKLAEICVRSGAPCGVEVLKELQQALLNIENMKDISVTLLMSECGTLCSDLDLRPLLGDKMESRTNYAHSIAEGVRSLLCTVESHSKLVVSGAWGPCSGVALALLALSDAALAGEHASFAVGAAPPQPGVAAAAALAGERASFAVGAAPPQPGVAALTTRCSRLSQSLINDLLIFGRRVSAPEALQGGLVSRSLPGSGPELIRAVAKDISSTPIQSVILKKQLLNLNKSSDSESTFLTGLERERDLLVEYWTSLEGQDVLRAALSPQNAK